MWLIDPKKNIEEWPRQLANLNIFESGQLTKEDKIKTHLYKIRDNFEDNKKIMMMKFNTLNQLTFLLKFMKLIKII